MAKEKNNKQFAEPDDVPTIDDAILNAGREIPFSEPTELGEAFKHLDDDTTNNNGFSQIDFNSRLTQSEINNCIIFDELKAKGILPQDANITLQKKRMSVSLGGKGREEKVEIASGARTATLEGRKASFLSKLLNRRND